MVIVWLMMVNYMVNILLLYGYNHLGKLSYFTIAGNIIYINCKGL